MKCNKCGAELLPNDTFCGNCGAKTAVHKDGDMTSKPVTVANENEVTPYSDFIKVPNNNSLSPNTQVGNVTQPLLDIAKNRKSKTSGIVIALVIILILITAFTVFNVDD